jgi:hypothetical protein
LPKGILTPSFIEIALAVTKCALLMNDDDGRHVIAIAHQRGAKNEVNTVAWNQDGRNHSEIIGLGQYTRTHRECCAIGLEESEVLQQGHQSTCKMAQRHI